jgi:hypothetical protein
MVDGSREAERADLRRPSPIGGMRHRWNGMLTNATLGAWAPLRAVAVGLLTSSPDYW